MRARALLTTAAILAALLVVPGLSAHAGALPPTISASVSPTPNGAGWNNTSPVTVTFTCLDDDTVVSCTAPVDVTTEGAAQNVPGSVEDNDGNIESTSVDVSLDLTAPTISGATLETANGAGWHNGAVTVQWTCADGLSGVDACPSDTVLSSEGADQSTSATVFDVAGNSAGASVDNIDIDLTDPTITGTASALPDGSSWYVDDVTVEWECTDDLSGIASCSSPSLITGEGSDLSASGSAVDVADNTSDATVAGIQIDRTAPLTTASAPSGYQNGDATVTLNASDNLSGVAATYYSLDGGSQESGTEVIVSGEGTHTLAFHSVDVAGNVETEQTVEVSIDTTPPTISSSLDPAPNADGWNNSDTTVTFTCGDGLSGIASCTDPSTITTDGAGQTVDGEAVDNAGNSSTTTATVNLDETAPEISGDRSPAANAEGWNNEDVTVSFSCSDGLSGITSCPSASTLGEGADQSVTGDAFDTAGNTASATVDAINVDLTAPTITGTILETPNADGWYNTAVTVQWSCSDALSGVVACPADTILGTDGANQTASALVADVAGNETIGEVTGINIDLSGPVIEASRNVEPNANGWNRTDVTVTWTCTDDTDVVLSESTYTFSTEGANLSRTVTCTDIAGNVSEDTQFVSLDKTAPLTTIDQFTGGDVRGIATDNLSGVESVRTSWTVAGTFEQDAVCYAGCGTKNAKWRITPPRPRPNVYRFAAWSIDLAGNVGPSDTDVIVALPQI